MAEARKDFSFDLSLKGARLFGEFDMILTGTYKVEVQEAFGHRSKEAVKADPSSTEPTSVRIGLKIIDGTNPAMVGKLTDQYGGLDLSDENVRNGWYTYLVSAGLPEEVAKKLLTGEIPSLRLDNNSVAKDAQGNKRIAHISVVTPPPGPDGKVKLEDQQKNFISPGRYQRELEGWKKSGGQPTGVNQPIAGQPAMATGASAAGAAPNTNFQLEGGAAGAQTPSPATIAAQQPNGAAPAAKSLF